MSQIDSDIDLYFNASNLGIGKQDPQHKLEVEGIVTGQGFKLPTTDINNENDKLIITNTDTSSITISKDKSIIFTNKLGINNVNPEHNLDIAGDMKVKGDIYGDLGPILSNDSDIIINKNRSYNNTNVFGNLKIMDNSDLILQNKILDNNNKEFIDFSDDKTFKINSNYVDGDKDISFYSQVNFSSSNRGVNIGSGDDIVNGGDLNVDNNVKATSITIRNIPERNITFDGTNASNIKMGTYSNFSSLSNNEESNQSLLVGHNLYADNNNVRVAETTDNYGYRGMMMNNVNGIQFYLSNKETNKNDVPNLPDVTISNSGQLIYSIPVLNIDFDIDDLDNGVYEYIKNEMSNKKIGSYMTFTTQTYLNNDKIFNVIKNSGSNCKCYIIDKKTNNVNNYFDITI